MSRSPRAFTLLEVMVVMFILGLLATIVVPRLAGRSDEARRVKVIADLKSIAQALDLYRLDAGTYPTTEQGLKALVEKPTVGTVPDSPLPPGRNYGAGSRRCEALCWKPETRRAGTRE